MRDEYEITESIQIMIEDGLPVKTASVIEQDINLTTPFDLLKCNMELLRHRKLENIIGENVQINNDATIKNCVIGDNAVIKNSVTLQNSLLFPGVEINSNENLKNMIITCDEIIDCNNFQQY
jgi:dTDP-glucose pyrophosphorylase